MLVTLKKYTFFSLEVKVILTTVSDTIANISSMISYRLLFHQQI